MQNKTENSIASEYVKFGGFLGFSSVFILVLLRERDIVSAVFDASIACIVMALAFKMLYGFTMNLHESVIRQKRAEQEAIETANAEKKKAGNKTLPNQAT